jgi:hypothetical protein
MFSKLIECRRRSVGELQTSEIPFFSVVFFFAFDAMQRISNYINK